MKSDPVYLLLRRWRRRWWAETVAAAALVMLVTVAVAFVAGVWGGAAGFFAGVAAGWGVLTPRPTRRDAADHVDRVTGADQVFGTLERLPLDDPMRPLVVAAAVGTTVKPPPPAVGGWAGFVAAAGLTVAWATLPQESPKPAAAAAATATPAGPRFDAGRGGPVADASTRGWTRPGDVVRVRDPAAPAARGPTPTFLQPGDERGDAADSARPVQAAGDAIGTSAATTVVRIRLDAQASADARPRDAPGDLGGRGGNAGGPDSSTRDDAPAGQGDARQRTASAAGGELPDPTPTRPPPPTSAEGDLDTHLRSTHSRYHDLLRAYFAR